MASGQLWLFPPPRPLVDRFGAGFFREIPARPGCLFRRASSRPAGESVAAGAPAEIQPGEPIPAVASVYRSFSAGGLNEPERVRAGQPANPGAANQSRCFSSCGRLARRPGDALTVKDRLDRTVATDSK